MKQKLITKLTSRKFFALLTALVIAILVAFNMGEEMIAKVTAIIGAFASLITYMFAEAYVDGKQANNVDNKEE